MTTAVDRRALFRVSGWSGVVAGLATLVIWFLPLVYGRPGSLEDQLSLHGNILYQVRLWMSFLNVLAVLVAGWGLTVCRWPDAPASASLGMLFLLYYGAAELLGRSVMIFTREYRWIARLVTETDPAVLESMRTSVELFDEVWAGAYALLLLTFILSAALFAVSLRGGRGMQRLVGLGLGLAAALGVVTLLASFLPGSPMRTLARYGYPVVQPASRFILGIWLLRQSGREERIGE